MRKKACSIKGISCVESSEIAIRILWSMKALTTFQIEITFGQI